MATQAQMEAILAQNAKFLRGNFSYSFLTLVGNEFFSNGLGIVRYMLTSHRCIYACPCAGKS